MGICIFRQMINMHFFRIHDYNKFITLQVAVLYALRLKEIIESIFACFEQVSQVAKDTWANVHKNSRRLLRINGVTHCVRHLCQVSGAIWSTLHQIYW